MTKGSVRRRLLTLVMVPTVIMSLLLGYFGYRDYQLLREGVVGQGTAEVRHLADLAEFGLATANLPQLTEAARAAQARGAVAVRIYNAEGELKASVGNSAAQPATSLPAAAGGCGEVHGLFVFCAPVLLKPLPVEQFREFGGGMEEVRLGRVELALSTGELHARRLAVIRDYAVVLVLIIGIGFVMARRVERDLAQPIIRLREGVERVGRGELAMQVEEDAWGELLVLQSGFNAMARSLVTNNAEQERRIADATAKLRQTLQELEQRNSELDREKRRAEAGSRAKSRFLAVMSHEIRTPLAGMIGMLMLLKRGGLDPEQESYVRHVSEAAETLRLLIDDILDYSRIEAGKLAIFQDPISLDRVLEDVATMLAPSAADKGLEFVVDVAADVPDAVIGDALRLRQILINLTANALKFTERGSVRIEVRRTGGTKEHLLFAVEDTGIGIPANELAHVFEGFTQVDSGPARRYGGSGLGASISKDLVRLMGGEIGVSSQVGKGSRFWVELPLTLDGTAANAERRFDGLRVAVVEHNGASRDAIAAALAALGAEVTPMAAAEESLADLQVDFLLLCDSGGLGNLEQAAARLRPRARHMCRVAPITAPAPGPEYDCGLSKPVTRIRLKRLLDETAREREERAPAADSEMRRLRLLVAEDDDINARVLEVLLRRLGHTVHRARDGREALEALGRESFDLAILDVRMPEVDGPAVASQWRAQERRTGGHLPMAALTANGSEEDMEICMAAGMDEFLVKPVSEKGLQELLRRWTGQPDRETAAKKG